MLNFFRNHKRAMMVLLLLLIVPGLGLVGIQGFQGFFDDNANVARVNGQTITQQQYDQALREQQERMRQMLGASFDAQMFNTPQMRRALLDNLIQQRIVLDAVRARYLTTSDAAVRQAILEIPAIASLRQPNGAIDLEQYRQLLAAQGLTPEQLDEHVRLSLTSQQIEQSIESTVWVPATLAQHISSLFEQQRAVQSWIFDSTTYLERVHPTDAQIKHYFDTHQAEFKKPETATIQYVILSATHGVPTLPDEAELKKYYQDHLAQYRTAEMVRASHILIKVAPDASAADRNKAKQQAEALLANVKAHPEQFATLAQQHSQDPGSAAQGGDLGFFSHGMMVKPFEEAAFKLKKMQISPLVSSDFGYHLIQVTDNKPATVTPFDQVKEAIILAVQKQQAAQKFAQDAEAFTQLAFEQPQTLQPLADKFQLAIHTADVARAGNLMVPENSPLRQPKVLEALFAEDSLKNHDNTAALDLGDQRLLVARVIRYQPPVVAPLQTVRDTVLQRVALEQALALARQEGAAKLAALQRTDAAQGFSPLYQVSRAATHNLPAAAIQAIFKIDAKKLPGYVGVDLGAQGYTIYRVSAVSHPPPLTPERLAAVQQELAELNGQAQWQAYLADLRTKANVKLYEKSQTLSLDAASS